MKKGLLSLLSLIVFATTWAQTKVYQTKAGQVKFFSGTKAEDIEAVNNQVDSKLATNGQLIFMLLIKGFKFDNATMQEHFNENYMESDKYTKSTFAGAITNINEVNFAKDGIYNVTVAGTLEIHGVKKQVTAPGTIEIKGGKVIAKSKFIIAIADFGIKGNYIGSKIASNIEIIVDCKYD
jgi:hypothetical protein